MSETSRASECVKVWWSISKPPPTPPAANDGETVTVTLSGEAANNFKTNLRLINNVARLTNGRQLDESALVAMAIGRLTDELMGGAA